MALSGIFADAQQQSWDRTRPGALGDLTGSQIEGYFGNQADIMAARQADPNFNISDWYNTFGKNEVMSGARGLSQPVGNIYTDNAGDTTFTSGLKAFDEAQYLANNQDVADAIKSGGFASGYQHYLNFGQKEGRDPNARLGFLAAAAKSSETPNMFDPNSKDYAATAGLFGTPSYMQGGHKVQNPDGSWTALDTRSPSYGKGAFFGQQPPPYFGDQMYAQGYQPLSYTDQYSWLSGPTYSPGGMEFVQGPGGQQALSGGPAIGGDNMYSTTDFLSSQRLR